MGTIVRVGQNSQTRLTHVVQDFSQNIEISSATLSVDGNSTNLSVTLQNNGDVTFRIFGVMLQGQFNLPLGLPNQLQMPNHDQKRGASFSPDTTIPFQINNTSLVPLFGPNPEMQPMNPQNTGFNPLSGSSHGNQPLNLQNVPHDDRTGDAASSYIALQPGQTVTLSFSGVIALPFGQNNSDSAINPIVGNNYTVQLTGEGFQTYSVTATS